MRNAKRAGIIAAAFCVVAAALAAGSIAAGQGGDEPQAWAAGKCYRATILDPEQQHTVRVIESPRGAWVRVQSDPVSPRVPGASPRTPVWLNTASVFTLQEVGCSGTPRE